MEQDFIDELTKLLNKHSAENNSNTPDFILAEYLLGCLEIYNATVNKRTAWFKDGTLNETGKIK